MVPIPVKRILSLDLIRGYLLCVIAIDHMFRFPNFLDIFTGRGEMWVSAAEGFFLISGVLVGIINRQKITDNPKKVFQRCMKRAFTLYLVSVCLTILSTLIAHALPSETIKPGLWTGGAGLSFVLNTLTLRYVYGWADFLPYYAAFMIVAPLAVYLLSKKKGMYVLAMSFLVWFFFRNNFYGAWQILFIIGIAAGFHMERVESLLKKLSLQKWLLISGAGLAASASLNLLPFLDNLKTKSEILFDKTTLAPGRLLFSLIFFATAYLLFSKYEGTIDKLSKGAFKLLGQNSLLVYSIQAVVLLIADALLPQRANIFQNFFYTASTVLVIYFLLIGTKAFLQFRVQPKRASLETELLGQEFE